MKKTLLTLLALCLVALAISVGACRRNASERERLGSNQSVLFDTLRTYQFRDSLNAASIGTLELTLGEFKEHRAKDAQLIKELGLRLRRVVAVSTTATESRYDITAKARPDILSVRDSLGVPHIAHIQRVSYRTPYIEVDGYLQADQLTASIVTYDTLHQVLHRVPRFKFWGINFGTKGVRQEVVSKNPHTRITYAEYIELKK